MALFVQGTLSPGDIIVSGDDGSEGAWVLAVQPVAEGARERGEAEAGEDGGGNEGEEEDDVEPHMHDGEREGGGGSGEEESEREQPVLTRRVRADSRGSLSTDGGEA